MKESNIIPLFLFEPKYRIWRHLLFIFVGAIITFNQVFVAYQDCQPILGNRIYFICFSSFALYLVAMYFNYFYLTPRILLKGKYIVYFVVLCAVLFFLPTLSIAEEYMVRNFLGLPHRISSYTNPLILVDNLATCMITAVCFCGISVIMLFRHWMAGNEQISRLESEHLKSELNKLKWQIAPAFLSKTLRNASGLVKIEPQKTTDILMQLSQLLRYQLYDCNRDKILLKSEMNFLARFLNLEQLSNPQFEYRIHTTAGVDNMFVSPMLFISLVQYVAKDSTSLDLNFNMNDKWLVFTCKSNNEKQLSRNELSPIQKRLELLYSDKQALISVPGMIELKLNIS